MKLLIWLFQKHRLLALVGMRLVQITGKHSQRIHPKHLVKVVPWYLKYINKRDVVLDYGCGNGQHTLKIAKKCKKITGFDFDDESVELAIIEAKKSKVKNVNFLKHNGEEKLPFKGGQFDVVFFVDVLEHIRNRDQALNEVYRVLRKKGKLLLSVPNVATSWKRLQKKYGFFYYTDPDHKIEYTKKQILNELKKHRFKVVTLMLGLWDTPLSGLFDLIGGISLGLYKRLRQFRVNYASKHPAETDGFEIVAIKI